MQGVCVRGVFKGCARGPVGHLSDENEALGPRNPFIRVPMPGFDKKMYKKYKKEIKNPKGGCVRGVHRNSSIRNSLGTT